MLGGLHHYFEPASILSRTSVFAPRRHSLYSTTAPDVHLQVDWLDWCRQRCLRNPSMLIISQRKLNYAEFCRRFRQKSRLNLMLTAHALATLQECTARFGISRCSEDAWHAPSCHGIAMQHSRLAADILQSIMKFLAVPSACMHRLVSWQWPLVVRSRLACKNLQEPPSRYGWSDAPCFRRVFDFFPFFKKRKTKIKVKVTPCESCKGKVP